MHPFTDLFDVEYSFKHCLKMFFSQEITQFLRKSMTNSVCTFLRHRRIPRCPNRGGNEAWGLESDTHFLIAAAI